MSFKRSPDPGLLVVLLLSGFLAVGALFINPVQTAYGLKSDEATYVSMTLSLAHDGDLTFEEHDLERFWPLYQSGPEGIFLKRGKGPEDQLYFGKSFKRKTCTEAKVVSLLISLRKQFVDKSIF